MFKQFVSTLKTKNLNSISKLSLYIFSDDLDEEVVEMEDSHVRQLFISGFSDLSINLFLKRDSGLFD